MHFPSSDWPPHFPLQLECPAALEKNEMPPSTLFKIETLPSIITFSQDLAAIHTSVCWLRVRVTQKKSVFQQRTSKKYNNSFTTDHSRHNSHRVRYTDHRIGNLLGRRCWVHHIALESTSRRSLSRLTWRVFPS